jgi:hypothetical protein
VFPTCNRQNHVLILSTNIHFPFQPLQLALAKVGVDKRVFEILAEAKREGKVLTNAELANKTGIDAALLKRILRYWESQGSISQPDDDAYTANNVTDALASLQGRTAIIHK